MAVLYRRIEDMCKRNGISVTDLCRATNISRASLSDLKMGRKRSLATDTLFKLAGYFKVSIDYLLGNTDDLTPADEKKEAPAALSTEEALGSVTSEAVKTLLSEIQDLDQEEAAKVQEYVQFLKLRRKQ